MTDKRKILEIGPGPNPMHHLRAGKGVEPFELKDGDDYTALDLQPNVFNTKVWSDLGSKYRDRIHTLVGNREDLPFKDSEFDEIVALGTLPENLEGLDRVIKKGGFLKVGVTASGLAKTDFISSLEAKGYQLVDTQNYDYQPIQKWKTASYKVFVFQKTE